MTKTLTKTHGYLALAGMALLAGFTAPERGVATPEPATPTAAPAAAAAPVAVAAPVNAVTTAVEEALEALSGSVAEKSHPEALKMAFKAYYSFKSKNPDKVRKPYLYYVDYGLDNRTARGYVFDMEQRKLVEGPFLVAHGRGSSSGADGVPMRFTNRPGSASTSLGLYVAAETYGFSGKSSGSYYTSIGLRMDGVSGDFNNTARARGVVTHGAPYVTASRAGRSEGCPAMEQSRARRLIPMIADGGMIFLFSPNSDSWIANDPWVNAEN